MSAHNAVEDDVESRVHGGVDERKRLLREVRIGREYEREIGDKQSDADDRTLQLLCCVLERRYVSFTCARMRNSRRC